MTCPRCGARAPQVKHTYHGYLCLHCGLSWFDEENNERGMMFSKMPPPATTKPESWPVWPWSGEEVREQWPSMNHSRIKLQALLYYWCDCRDATIDFCEREIGKVGA